MKRILLAISGLNPQVITETLYCLHKEHRFVDAIYLVTTRAGKELLLSRFLGGGAGKFYQFCKEYGIEPGTIDFHPGNIHTVADENGVELDDILSQADNEKLLQVCLELSCEFTKSKTNVVYFLVAGGRKTMTSCLSLAAQLYGRKQDRIYHVLVSPEFESNRDFWYPPKESVPLELIDRKGERFFKESRYAKLQLISIPFVSIRRQLAANLLAEPHSPGVLLASLVRDEERVLEISLRSGTVSYGEVEMDMHPARLTLLAFFCELKKNCGYPGSKGCNECWECFITAEEVLNQQERITSLYKILCSSRDFNEMSDTGIVSLNAENFNSYKSKIKKDLIGVFGTMAAPLVISATGKRPDTRYGILLDRHQLSVKL